MTVKLTNRILNFIVLAGIALILSGFITGKILDSFYNDAKKTSAIIVSIQDDGEVLVDYMIGHNEYNNVKLGSYDESMRIGSSVNIFYDPTTPRRIKWEGYKSPCKTLYVMGAIFIVFGVGMRIWNEAIIRKRKRQRRQARAARAAKAARGGR